MEATSAAQAEHHRMTKTRIIATAGPACESPAVIRELILSGVDIFRLNFAHGSLDWLADLVRRIREISAELNRPTAILGDLSGPKIRLGELPGGEFRCGEGQTVRFVRGKESGVPGELTCTYESLIDDVRTGDRILIADGTVTVVVTHKSADGQYADCVVAQPGLIRSRQGVNLPGVVLSTPSVTEKDRNDLHWALQQGLDFIGLSFVRRAEDITSLKQLIEGLAPANVPLVVAKIEKTEAVADLQNILLATDAVMVARGDLGVESEISRLPVLQKQIIRACNEQRIPVITATQMLDSMQSNDLPTRAEVSDVANAVIDGTDAVMLSGETAIGQNPVQCVRMMDRIAHAAEPLVPSVNVHDLKNDCSRRARPVTEAVTRGAIAAADYLNADLIVVATITGRTALALSRLRSSVPILAVTDRPHIARRMCLYWGVTSVLTDVAVKSAPALLQFVVEWGRRHAVVSSGSRIVVVGHTDWLGETHDLCMVHLVP